MVFRADESARSGFDSAKNYLVSKDIDKNERERSANKLLEISELYGPVIDGYPSWHPLVTHHDDLRPVTTPSERCMYKGIDHIRCFINAFITCPYGDGQKVLETVDSLPHNPIAKIDAQKLDVQFYHPDCTPILVTCSWLKPFALNGIIPAGVAIPLMLQKELGCWESAARGESWETMRPYFLGLPYGSRSSLFVDQKTGLTMKKIWNTLVDIGTLGPLKVATSY